MKNTTKPEPTISIVIPALNEEPKIEKTLKSLRNQTIEKNRLELIVVDNGSTDRTVSIAEKLADQVLVRPNCTVGAARNYGAQISQGDILVCTDADCEFENNWLETGIRLLEEHPNTVFGGGLKTPKEDASWVEEYWLLNQSGEAIQQQDLMGSCIFIKKNHFTLVSGFDESITSGEDSDLSERLRKAGLDISTSPLLSVIHRGSPKTLSKFIKRQVWHSENYIKKIKNSMSDKMFYLTIIYLISAISMITGTLIQKPILAAAGTFLVIAIPTALSYKRIKRSKFKPRKLSELIKIYTLDQVYIIGRCIGLIKGIIKPITNPKKTK